MMGSLLTAEALFLNINYSKANKHPNSVSKSINTTLGPLVAPGVVQDKPGEDEDGSDVSDLHYPLFRYGHRGIVHGSPSLG